MKYHLRNPSDQTVTGPFELDDIEAKLKAGEISTNTLARSEHLTRESWPAKWPPASEPDWLPLRRIPRFAGLITLQDLSPAVPPPVPETPAIVIVAPLSDTAEINFCPGCAHPLQKPLPAGEAGVCERCGRTLGFAPPPPVPTVNLLPNGGTKSGGASGGCLTAIGTALFSIFLILLGAVIAVGIILALLANLLNSNCRA